MAAEVGQGGVAEGVGGGGRGRADAGDGFEAVVRAVELIGADGGEDGVLGGGKYGGLVEAPGHKNSVTGVEQAEMGRGVQELSICRFPTRQVENVHRLVPHRPQIEQS